MADSNSEWDGIHNNTFSPLTNSSKKKKMKWRKMPQPIGKYYKLVCCACEVSVNDMEMGTVSLSGALKVQETAFLITILFYTSLFFLPGTGDRRPPAYLTVRKRSGQLDGRAVKIIYTYIPWSGLVWGPVRECK